MIKRHATTDAHCSRNREIGPALLILAVWAVSRWIFLLKGGSFLARPLDFAMQYLDPALLRGDLLRSLLYLHTQPPLFNFFLGAVLKLSSDPGLSYELLFRTMGALFPLLFYAVFRLLEIRRWIALAATSVFMFNPTLLLYENLLYYTYVEGFLVMLSIFLFACWCTGYRPGVLLLFWLSMLCLGLTRSLFHPVFFFAVAAGLALHLRRSRPGPKRAGAFLLSSAAALLPLLALCLKNLLVFGFFGTSSWAGMSLWTKVNGFMPEQLEELHSRGIVSRVALQAELRAFQPIDHYFDDSGLQEVPCHHPADCAVRKSTGKPNFNHGGYVQVSRQLMKDAVALIFHDPGLFIFYTAGSYSLTQWYCSDSVHALFAKNMEILEKTEKIYRFLFFGFLGAESKHADPGMLIRTVAVTLFYLVLYAGTLAILIRNDDCIPACLGSVCLFCLLVHAYTIGISSIIEFGENNRFRFPVDAACAVLAAGNIQAWTGIRRRRADGSAAPDGRSVSCRTG